MPQRRRPSSTPSTSRAHLLHPKPMLLFEIVANTDAETATGTEKDSADFSPMLPIEIVANTDAETATGTEKDSANSSPMLSMEIVANTDAETETGIGQC